MKRNFSISIKQDRRRERNNSKYPVVLRVYLSETRKSRLYSLGIEYTKKEFEEIWSNEKPKKEFKKKRQELDDILTQTKSIAIQLKEFSIEDFESQVFGKQKNFKHDLLSLFDEIIEDKKALGQITTAEKYFYAKESILKYLNPYAENKGSRKITSLRFSEVTKQFLDDYFKYQSNIRNLSVATIAIYIRNIRAVYRKAIEKGLASQENYPFGEAKNKYTIKTSGKVNKALNTEELELLKKAEPQDEGQLLAKDFWFFSYYSYGMNIRDIAELKHTSINGEMFTYERAKTKHTKKHQSIKQVPLSEPIKEIISRRKDPDSAYLFGIIDDSMNLETKLRKIKNFIKGINKHIKRLALHAGINEDFAKEIGTYHARHSFATITARKGTSIALISEILHDGNIKTTQEYINSFPKEDYLELSNSL